MEYLYRQEIGQKPVAPKPELVKPGETVDPDKAAIGWLEARLRPRYKASDIALQRLGAARARAVEAAMVKAAGIDPKRLFVITAPPETGSQVEMNLQLR